MPKKTIGSCGKSLNLENRYAALAQALVKDYLSIAEVNLYTSKAIVLKSSEDQTLEGKELPWDILLNLYSQNRVCPDDHAVLQSLTYDCLKKFIEQNQEEFTVEARCIGTDASYKWVEIRVLLLSLTEKKLLVSTRSIDEQRMLKSIVDQFVFQNVDYFILLNAQNNSYTMFSGGNDGTPLPPVSGDDYSGEVARFNAKYLIPEDYERVTANMQISHVLKMLEHETSYSFSSSGITSEGVPRRSRIQFRYYDKATGLILLTRTNITEMFMEEQKKNERLTAALYDAQHDALTGLLNQKGIEAFVVDSLKQLHGAPAALLFIDVDNFKMVNDTLGHQKGDKLLRFLANSIQKTAENAGVAGRIGGDEFLIYLPQFSTIAEIANHAQQVCHVFDPFIKDVRKELPISCSVGISIYPKDGTDYDCLLRKADQALYTSKRYGKNRCYFYSEDIPSAK